MGSSPRRPVVRIRLLGAFELWVDERSLGGDLAPRLQSLVAWLALHPGEPQGRDTLASLLWPESDPSQARTNVRNLLHRLSMSLPHAETLIEIGRDAVTWRDDLATSVDMDGFEAAASAAAEGGPEALAEALAIYRGELLPACHEDWVVAERARLRARVVRLLQRAVSRHEAGGDLPAAVAEARRLAELEPADGDAARTVLRLLAELGDRAGLVREYRAHVARVRRARRGGPDAATTELYERSLRRLAGTGRASGDAPPDLPPNDGAGVAPPASAPPGVPSHNLPSEPAAFVGRERKLQEASVLLADPTVRLLTLTGPGGTGKTRLAIEVATRFVVPGSPFSDGVRFVDLAPVRTPDAIAPAISAVLGVPESGDSPAIETLGAHLRDRQMLLVLDNFEQVVDAAPQMSVLLRGARWLKLLVTSRVPLRASGEHRFAVPPLALPPLNPLPAPDELRGWESVALFALRARAADRSFALTLDNARAVAEICRRLDGLPLAIELAAAHVADMNVEQVHDALDRRLQVLIGGPRDAAARQQTLRAVIEWGHALLRPSEAAAAIAGDGDSDMTASLDALVDAHFVIREPAADDGDVRFRMLETIREYALEQLEGSGEAEECRSRHARHGADLAQAGHAQLQGEDQVRWMARFEPSTTTCARRSRGALPPATSKRPRGSRGRWARSGTGAACSSRRAAGSMQ